MNTNKMLTKTAQDYSKYVDVDIDEKLSPVNQSIDEMLARLEEFQTMVTLVQQERCNSVGLTGALNQTVDNLPELSDLCIRIDALEKFVQHVKTNMNNLENQVEAAEEQFGLVDSTTKLKSFFSPLFKKTSDSKNAMGSSEVDFFKTEDYFSTSNTEN